MVGIKEDWIGIVENGAKEIRENYGLEAEVTHDLLGDKYQVIHKLLEDTPFIKEVRKGIEKLYGVGTETMHEVLRDTYLVVPAEGPLVPAKKIQPKVPYTDARWVESSEGIGIEWKLGKEDEFGRRSHLTKDDYGSLDKLIRDTMRQGGNVNIYGTEIEDFENLHDFAKDFYERLGIKEPEEGYEIDVGELQRYGSHAEKVDEGVIGYMRNPINDKEIKYVEGPYSLNIEKNGRMYSTPKDESEAFEELVKDTGYEIILNGERKKLDPSEDNASEIVDRDYPAVFTLPSELRRFSSALYKFPSMWNKKGYNEYYDMF